MISLLLCMNTVSSYISKKIHCRQVETAKHITIRSDRVYLNCSNIVKA